MHKVLIAGLAAVFSLALVLAPVPAARADALVTGNINLRAGPGAQAPRLAVLPAGAQVAVLGCLPQGWCDVVWGGLRGWATGRYLRQIVPQVINAAPYVLALDPRYLRPAPPWLMGAPTIYYGYAPGWSYGWGMIR